MLESRARALGVSEFKCNERNRPISVDNRTRQLDLQRQRVTHIPKVLAMLGCGDIAANTLARSEANIPSAWARLGYRASAGCQGSITYNARGACIRPSHTLRSVIKVPNVCERRKYDNGGRRAREWNGEKGVCFAVRMCFGGWPKDFKPRPS